MYTIAWILIFNISGNMLSIPTEFISKQKCEEAVPGIVKEMGWHEIPGSSILIKHKCIRIEKR